MLQVLATLFRVSAVYASVASDPTECTNGSDKMFNDDVGLIQIDQKHHQRIRVTTGTCALFSPKTCDLIAKPNTAECSNCDETDCCDDRAFNLYKRIGAYVYTKAQAENACKGIGSGWKLCTKNSVHVECGHGWASDVDIPGMWYDKVKAGCGGSNTMTWYKSHRGDSLASAHCCRVARCNILGKKTDGVKVVRGPSWISGNDDGGAGGIGVTRVWSPIGGSAAPSPGPGVVTVEWKMSRIHQERAWISAWDYYSTYNVRQVCNVCVPVTSSNGITGLKVVRGLDWISGDVDGGLGDGTNWYGVGVVEPRHGHYALGEDEVIVKWPPTVLLRHRTGKEGRYDLCEASSVYEYGHTALLDVPIP